MTSPDWVTVRVTKGRKGLVLTAVAAIVALPLITLAAYARDRAEREAVYREQLELMRKWEADLPKTLHLYRDFEEFARIQRYGSTLPPSDTPVARTPIRPDHSRVGILPPVEYDRPYKGTLL